MRQRGYISGETLRELIDPSHFKIISTWSTLEAWKTWQGSPQRVLIEAIRNAVPMGGWIEPKNTCQNLHSKTSYKNREKLFFHLI